MNKFWKWTNQAPGSGSGSRVLTLNGVIAEESWFDDEVSPREFREDLYAGEGDVTVWINSPGGDCIAAAQIFNMLRDYPGRVTIKIDGLAASAASVIAMAGDTVLMSPVAMMMIHNPSTFAWGDHNDMQKAVEMLEAVKDSIIDAYVLRTGMSRQKISQLMEDETWMDSRKAVQLGFADGVIERTELYRGIEPEEDDDDDDDDDGIDDKALPAAMLFGSRSFAQAVINKVIDKCEEKEPEKRVDAKPYYDRLFGLMNSR